MYSYLSIWNESEHNDVHEGIEEEVIIEYLSSRDSNNYDFEHFVENEEQTISGEVTDSDADDIDLSSRPSKNVPYNFQNKIKMPSRYTDTQSEENNVHFFNY